ncbi:MAG TPA: potassium-transporting ATPase subunit KdpA, partial [Myxococcaceae bacterium]
MTAAAWGQLALFSALVLLTTKPLGVYMARVFEGEHRPFPRIFGPVERFLFRLSGVDPSVGQTWVRYTGSVLVFSLFSLLVTYAILRLQHVLPLNPQKLAAVDPALAFNTSASFTTNTNWQAYGGESTMSYLSQMAGLAWHNFISAAAGIGIAIALARGLTRRQAADAPRTLGNFWADLIRATVYVLLPLSLVFALLLVSQGVIQNFSAYREVTTLEGAKQVVALGPVASQEAIKELGTNGGGFFNANSAHPFENPTPFTNLLEMWLIFAIPAGLTYTYGRMARDTRQGWAILAAMAVLFLGGTLVAHRAESRPNQALASLSLDHGAGNMEGKEVRFGTAASALFATVTTDASCGAVNAAHDSFNPLGGLVPLVN